MDDEYEWKKTLPPGIRFEPSDQEIITCYLNRKSLNLAIRPGIIRDLDIYDYEPHQLKGHAFHHDDGRMYFFSPLKKKRINGKSSRRNVADGKGYWKTTQTRAKVKDSNKRVIGTKQSLVYYIKKNDRKTSWLMSEYRVAEDSKTVPFYNETVNELSLCVIYIGTRGNKKDSSSSNASD